MFGTKSKVKNSLDIRLDEIHLKQYNTVTCLDFPLDKDLLNRIIGL